MKYTVRHGSSYWTGTLSQIVKWSREECYNNTMRQRQDACLLWLNSPEALKVAVDILSNLP